MNDRDVDLRISRLVVRLLHRTSEGKINWELYADEGREVFYFSTAASSVELWCQDGDGLHPFILRILDESGVELEKVSSRLYPEEIKDAFYRLYIVVRRKTLQVDRKIDLLLAELDED